MVKIHLSALLLMLMICAIGCGQQSLPAPAAASGQVQKGQPKLPLITLWLGDREIRAEQAITNWQIQQGLMFRESLDENEGMLFIFSSPSRVSFWMRNTSIPLSIAYIDPEGLILEIHDMRPFDETPILARNSRVQFALEMNQGWFRRHGIDRGAMVRTEKGSLRETYFPGR
jgi:uncharacterized protein